jgi:pyruvate kinase
MYPSNNHFTPTWTKYVVGIGPASSSPEVIEGLIKAGANFFRSNFAHAQYEEYCERKQIVEELNKKLGTNVWMQADLQGRNIRLQKFENEKGGLDLEAGHEYTFVTVGEDPQEGEIIINDKTLHTEVKAGEPIVFADGLMEGVIVDVIGQRIRVKMNNAGFLKSRKSINVPESQLIGSSITDKDRADLAFLLETGVDVVAVSFIASAEEMHEVRKLVGDRPVKLIAKIERKEAMKNITEIIAASDGVMIARGDLGVEMPMEEIPLAQKMLTDLCRFADKPVITATQMMMSITTNLRPTRAEVTDVSNAVLWGSDAIMLSEETMVGVDPVNSLTTMVRIAKRTEEAMRPANRFFPQS